MVLHDDEKLKSLLEEVGDKVALATLLCPSCEKLVVCFYHDLMMMTCCPFCTRLLPGKGTERVQ